MDTSISPWNSDNAADDDDMGDLTDLHLSPNNTMEDAPRPTTANDFDFDDDDETANGHSLPTVAEVRANGYLDNPHQQRPSSAPPSHFGSIISGSKSSFPSTSTLQNRLCHSHGLCALMALLVILVLAVLAFSQGAEVSNIREEAAIEFLLTYNISERGALLPEGTANHKKPSTTFLTSPQQKALYWIVHDDPQQLEIPVRVDDNDGDTGDELVTPFLQRYVAGVFVYSLTTLGTMNYNNKEMEDIWQKELHLLSGKHVCDWNSPWKRQDGSDIQMGFQCNKHRLVTDIILQTVDLHGAIPYELFYLKHLTRLALDANRITGAVPFLHSIRHLSLAFNEMSSELPAYLGGMTQLSILRLSENMLNGDLSTARIHQLTQLQVLALDGNELKGDLQPLYSLTNLEELYLGFNSLSGGLSNDSFRRQTKLRVLDMNNNRITGPLPDVLFNMTNLEVVDFHFNALDGHINPLAVNDNPKVLKYLDISENFLEGGIPESFVVLSQLTHLDVSSNRFDDLLPTNLGQLSKMETLLLTDNVMFGPQAIPDSIRQMTNLRRLSLQLTARTGPLPEWLSTLTHLQLLALDDNHISGTIPSEISAMTDLKYCMLNRNWLSSTVPTELVSIPTLTMLMVDNNRLTGSLETCSSPNMGVVIADCGDPLERCPDCDKETIEISCPCCTSCCSDMDEQRCNTVDWLNQVNAERIDDYEESRSEEHLFTSADEHFEPAT